MKPVHPDPAQIQRSLALFLTPGAVVEIRVPKTDYDGTISGYFDNIAKAIEAVSKMDKLASGIYVTLNEVTPGLIARAHNRATPVT